MFGRIAQPVRPLIEKRAVDLVRVAEQDDLRVFPALVMIPLI